MITSFFQKTLNANRDNRNQRRLAQSRKAAKKAYKVFLNKAKIKI
jgi:hypothetical protein